MVGAKQFCNLSFQLLDPSANHSKNEIDPSDQERFHANSFVVFRFTFYYDVGMKYRNCAVMNMPDNLTSMTDIFVEFEDGTILIA
jgi:hypothetical protein